MYLGNKIQKLWLRSVAVTFVCLRALHLRVLLRARGICAHGSDVNSDTDHFSFPFEFRTSVKDSGVTNLQ